MEEKLGGAAGKNAKRRESRKKAKASEGDVGGDGKSNGIEGQTEPSTAESKADAVKNWRAAANNPVSELDKEAEKEKQARNLRKKLRQARELREKKDQGENLLPEQFEKVIKIQEIIRQLDNLGFDAEGERKVKETYS